MGQVYVVLAPSECDMYLAVLAAQFGRVYGEGAVGIMSVDHDAFSLRVVRHARGRAQHSWPG